MGMNELGEDVIMHTGLQGIDITRLEDHAIADDGLLGDDPFADLVIDPPIEAV
jgi:hypothetical protein